MTDKTTRIKLLFIAAALLAGLWWIPVRFLESLGFSGAWSSVAMAAGALPLIVVVRRRLIVRPALKDCLGAIAIGAGMLLYGVALTQAEIIRVLILFYLAPMWSLLIEFVFMNRKIGLLDLAALALALTGIVVVQGASLELGLLPSLGDAMALASGLIFAIGSAIVFENEDTDAMSLATMVVATVGLLGLPIALVLSHPITVSPASIQLLTALGTAFLAGVVFLAPVVFITSKAAVILPPSVLTMLFTLEVIAGVVSSAIATSEPFGLPQITGSVLIVGAVLVSASKTARVRPEPS